ncbi:MAG TPA: hypothetical protein VGM52_02610 [Herbaspirillum sp.]|jgi:hypothetical protein
MKKMSGKEACYAAANLIEEQLAVLSMSGAAVSPQENALPRQQYLRVLTGNALLAVECFLKEHHISDSRTLEIQFLRHVCNAIVNGNVFSIAPGHIPGASFDGLVIDNALDGRHLFGDDVTEGFMAFDDAINLLDQLARHLRNVPSIVSGGDAG